MSNGIQERQNEEKSITKLAAQRQLYYNAGILDAFNFVLSVIVPLILSVLQGVFPQWSTAKSVTYVLSISMIFLSLALAEVINKDKKLAALIQQDFDTYVFTMPWDDKLFDKKINHSAEIAEYSAKILKNESKRGKLINWYTVGVDNLPLDEGIRSCQKESVNWDAGLRKRYRNISLIGIIIICAIIFAIGIANNESMDILLMRFAFIAPMLRWLVALCKDLDKDIKTLGELSGKLNANRVYDMEDLKYIQKDILMHRSEAVKVPDFIYLLFQKRDEDKEQRIVEMDSKK